MKTIYAPILGICNVTAETKLSIIVMTNFKYVDNQEFLFRKKDKGIVWFDTEEEANAYKLLMQEKEARKAELLAELEKAYS